MSGEHKKSWKRIRRPAFTKLAKDSHNLRGYTKEAERILSDTTETYDFVLERNAWLEAYEITSEQEQKLINEKVVQRVRTLEELEGYQPEILEKLAVARLQILKSI